MSKEQVGVRILAALFVGTSIYLAALISHRGPKFKVGQCVGPSVPEYWQRDYEACKIMKIGRAHYQVTCVDDFNYFGQSYNARDWLINQTDNKLLVVPCPDVLKDAS